MGYLIGQETLESGAGDREALYDTVQRLRPHWLQLNASVFIDGTRRGNPLVLREVMTASVEQVRFHPPEKSVALYGGQFMNGVIEVTRRQ